MFTINVIPLRGIPIINHKGEKDKRILDTKSDINDDNIKNKGQDFSCPDT